MPVEDSQTFHAESVDHISILTKMKIVILVLLILLKAQNLQTGLKSFGETELKRVPPVCQDLTCYGI